MGTICPGRSKADVQNANRNDTSMSSELKSTSLSVMRSMTATELVSAAERPSKPAHTRAARIRRSTAAAARVSDAPPHAPPPGLQASPAPAGSKDGRATPLSASTTHTKPFRPPSSTTDVDSAASQTSSQPSSRGRRAQKARAASRAASKQQRRKKGAAAAAVTTPVMQPLKSLETSQVLGPSEPTTPPAPKSRRHSRRDSRALSLVDVPGAGPATTTGTASSGAAASPPPPPPPAEPPQPSTSSPASKPTPPVPAPSISPPPPPPVRLPALASPSPAVTPGITSFSNSNPFFAEMTATPQFSDSAVNYHPSVSADLQGGEQPSFEYDNGYGMFCIDAGDGANGGEAGTAATSPQRQAAASPPTTPKAVQPLSRRNRRESFVSFGGEIRLA